MNMPKDSAILLSLINMKLRDFYPSLDALCEDLEWNKEEIITALEKIDYTYNSERNAFV